MNIEELKKKYDIRIDSLEDFTRIQIKDDESPSFYQDLAECIKECDDSVLIANGVMGNAKTEEFLQGEKIIQDIIQEINPNWTKKQKAAYVHYKMGELISYAPNFNFWRYNSQASCDMRNIWKSLIKGQSVCNGITSIQRNILARVGITTRELSSGTHSFMLVETEEGNIITDATWDLKNSLFGARPMYFGKTYEQLRRNEEGFSNAHKLEEPPENVIEIEEEELREIYHSLGYTTEDRSFIFPILDKVNEINTKEYESMEEKVTAFLTMFIQNFSKEATHLSETRTILEQCMYELGIEPQDLITKFVYDKNDKSCENPYLSLFIHNEHIINQMKLLDVHAMQFKSMDVTEFDEKYKLHNLDTTEPVWRKCLKKTKIEEKQDEKDL